MSEIIFSGIVPAGKLQKFIDVFTPLVLEGRLQFSEDGVTCRVVEPGNVATINPGHLDAEAFEHYDVPGQAVMGVDFNTLDERLSGANADDLVELELDMETRRLHIQFRNISHKIGLIDPDKVRDNPDHPDLDLPNTVTLTGGQLSETVREADKVTDQITVQARPDDREVAFIGEGDIDDMTVTYGDEETIAADVPEAVETILSLDYMADIVAPMNNDTEVTLTFGNEFPVMLDWEAAEGDVTVHQMLAPRIQTN